MRVAHVSTAAATVTTAVVTTAVVSTVAHTCIVLVTSHRYNTSSLCK